MFGTGEVRETVVNDGRKVHEVTVGAIWGVLDRIWRSMSASGSAGEDECPSYDFEPCGRGARSFALPSDWIWTKPLFRLKSPIIRTWCGPVRTSLGHTSRFLVRFVGSSSSARIDIVPRVNHVGRSENWRHSQG